ncbi:MAG: 3-oxoacyl-ACP reductase FabG [Clostridiales bacterium]|nr:3-oxoacyl-ACP reductase FabG [Clostridiales bacterium]
MKKTVLITGGSRGIGRACALKFAVNGYNVVFCYRDNDEAADETEFACMALGADCRKFKCDVSDENEVKRMFAYAECEFGGADVLVNNAGVARSGLFTDFSREDYDFLFNTNVLGAMLCAREAAKLMIRNGGGRIINVSSMWGVCGSSCEAIYSASKAAVIGLTKALAKELSLSHITVNAIAPGVIDTEMNSCYDKETMDSLVAETLLGRLGTADDVASAALYLAGDGASFITGEVLNVNGGFVI